MTLGSPCIVHSGFAACAERIGFRTRLSEIEPLSNPHGPRRLGNTEAGTKSEGYSAGSDRKIAVRRLLRSHPTVRASATAGSGTGPKRFIDDGLDRARATAAFRAAT